MRASRGSTRSRFALASTLLSSAAMLACVQGVATEPAPSVAGEPAAPSVARPVAAEPIPAGRLALEVEAIPEGPPPLRGGYSRRIYTMRTDGSEVRDITPAGEMIRAPAFSPDGSRLAYESFHDDAPDIWIVRPDGTGRTFVARNATSPFWLDDTQLGYQCGTSLCAIRDDRSEQRTLLARRPRADAEDFDYRLSADRKTVVFTRMILPGRTAAASWVYLVNIDGTGERMLTSATQGDSPQWSPTGRSVAFMSARYGATVADADGGAVKSVWQQDGAYAAGPPAWSPTGTELVFANTSAIYFLRPEGSGTIRRVTMPNPIASVNGWINAVTWGAP